MICCSTTKILICALAAGLAFGAAVGRPVAVFDFEKWNDSRDSPAGEDWRWGFSQQGTNGFTACELSQAEFHDGRASLHLKDANKGNLNHTMWYQFTRDEAKSMEGKVVRASAWIKQVSASDPRSVGIALYANGSDGKPVYVRNGVGTRAASDWVCVHAAVKMPDETKSARLVFNCANGYGNTGEIYVDDVVVSTDLADHPKPTLLPPSASAGWSFSLPEPEDTPEESAYRRGWREQPPADEDGRARPKIENGTWYIGDHPEFYMGVWLYNSDRQWGPKANPLGIGHPAYTTPPGEELFDDVRFLLVFDQCSFKHLVLVLPGNDNHAVAITEHDVTVVNFYTATDDGHTDRPECGLHRTGRIDAAGKDRESHFPDILGITAASIQYHTRKPAYLACKSHNIAEVTALVVASEFTHQHIAGLGGIDALMDRKVIAGLALHRDGATEHMALGIDGLNTGVHYALTGSGMIVVSHISGGQNCELLTFFLGQFHNTSPFIRRVS